MVSAPHSGCKGESGTLVDRLIIYPDLILSDAKDRYSKVMNTHGIKQVGYLDIAGGGQIRVDGNYAYVGHMEFPHGRSIVDDRGLIYIIDRMRGLHVVERV